MLPQAVRKVGPVQFVGRIIGFLTAVVGGTDQVVFSERFVQAEIPVQTQSLECVDVPHHVAVSVGIFLAVPPAVTAVGELRVVVGHECFSIALLVVQSVVVGDVGVEIGLEVSGLFVFLAVVPRKHGAGFPIGVESVCAAVIVPVTVFVYLLVFAHVVHRTENGHPAAVGESRGEAFGHIAVFRAVGHVGVDVPGGQIFLFDFQVNYHGLVIVHLSSELFILICFLVGRNGFNGIGRHVGQRRLYVAEKLFASHEHTLHLLALIGNFAVLVHFEARQQLDGCAQGRAGRQTEGIGVKLHRVLLHREQACEGGNGGFAQHHVIGHEGDVEGVDNRILSGEFHLAALRMIAQRGHAQRIVARPPRRECETSVGGSLGAYIHGGIAALQQFYPGRCYWSLSDCIGHFAAQTEVLCGRTDGYAPEQDDREGFHSIFDSFNAFL